MEGFLPRLIDGSWRLCLGIVLVMGKGLSYSMGGFKT